MKISLIDNTIYKNSGGKRVKLEEIEIEPKKVRLAKKIVGKYMMSIREECAKNNTPDLYFVILIMMHIMSQDQIDTYTAENIDTIIKAYEEKY